MSGLEATARIENGKIIIEMPCDTLIFAQKNNPEFFRVKIVDKERFLNEVANRFINFDTDQETGLSRFYQMLDDITSEIVEDGNDCIKVKFDPDGDWE